jgi:cbb3-type cytochrome oxidase maturation protein
MSVIFILIPLSIVLAACFLGAFIWAIRSGQYEDTCTPAMRVLLEEPGARVPASALAPRAAAATGAPGRAREIQGRSDYPTRSNVRGQSAEHDAPGASGPHFT